MSDVPESLRDGRYRLERLLGEGGQAATFEGTDRDTGKRVAVKRFRVRGASTWKEVELAEREARVLASISHPSLPRYVDHFEEGGELYLVTEKIEGESLAELKKRGETLDVQDIVRLLREAGRALDYLHGRAPPVIHRDLKPSNVIRRPDGSFVFIDFGAVRDRMRPEGGSTVVGTFGYMAPEQFQGRALPASDVYAIGATSLAMLTGREPEELPHRGLGIDVRAAVGSHAGSAMVRVLESMLEPDPDRRAARIAPLLEGFDARAPSSVTDPSRTRERRREDDRAERKRGRRQAKEEARAARRREKHERRRAGGRSVAEPGAWAQRVPGLVLFMMMAGITIAQLALIAVLRIGVPLLLVLLSLFFGRGLREAAGRVAAAGGAAGRALERAKDVLGGRVPSPEQAPRIRVDAVRAEQAKETIARAEERAEREAAAIDEEMEGLRRRLPRRPE